MSTSAAVFPEALKAYSSEQLFHAFYEAPSRIRQATADLTLEEVGRRARGPDRWSVKEIVQHLADSEIVGAARLRLILAEERVMLPVYNQDRWAEALGYADVAPHDLHAAVALFDALRSSARRLLERVTAADWSRQATHPEWGPITLRQWLELYADHGERHLAQILDLRERLGKPISIAPLITARLY